MTHPIWPLFDIRIREGDLELRLPNDEELAELCTVAREGVHDPATMPFIVPWTDKPSPQFERDFVQWHWGQRASWCPESWSFEPTVFLDGTPIGSQGISGKRFSLMREVRTGSWLGRRHQGRGIGKRMRRAILRFAFEGLGARIAHSGALEGNAASRGVSTALGYEENGKTLVAPRGEPVWEQLLILTRARWASHATDATTIHGLEPCISWFGVTG